MQGFLVVTHPASDPDELVWYVTYGSNLSSARLRCYLAGGTPDGSTSRLYPACAHGAEILDDRPVRLPHRLYFARSSKNWTGGGVAFLDVERTHPPPTYGRAWLITMSQLRHLACQENADCPVEISVGQLRGEPSEIRPEGWYRVLLPLDEVDGLPAVTLTGRPKSPNAPHPAYLATVRAGIREAWPDLSEPVIDSYLAAAAAAGGAT